MSTETGGAPRPALAHPRPRDASACGALLVVGALFAACVGPHTPPEVRGAIAPEPAPPAEPIEPAPRTRLLPPIPSAGLVGTAHPIAVQASSADGRWVVACQARVDTNGDGVFGVAIGYHGDFGGDRMIPYLIVRDGEGESLESFIAAAPGEDYLVTLEAGALTLRDLPRGARRVLDTGGLVRDAAADGGDMIAGFDGDRSLVYLRGATPTTRRLIVHDLADGHEAILDPGPGKLLGAYVPRGSGKVVVFADLPAFGEYPRRYRYTSRHRGPCRGPMMSSYSSSGGGPPSETRVIELERGDRWVLPAAEGRLVGLLGDSAIVRQGDGSLWIASLAGGAPSRPLVDEACQGSVLAASAANESLLVRCHGSDPAQHSLRLYDPLGVRVLRADNTYDDRDAWRGGDHPRTLIWSHGPRLAIDLEAGHVRVVPTPAGARHLVEDDHHILHRVDQALSLTRITDGAQRRLAAEADEYPRYRQKGSIAAVDRVIVDLAAGELLGAVPTLPEALTAAGHALTPDPIPGRLVHVYDAVAVGPLRWRWPAPCEGKCPAGRFDR